MKGFIGGVLFFCFFYLGYATADEAISITTSKAKTPIPADVIWYFEKSLIKNSLPEIRAINKQEPVRIDWRDVYDLNLNMILEDRYKNQSIYVAAIKALSVYPEKCKRYYEWLYAVIDKKFSGTASKEGMLQLLTNYCLTVAPFESYEVTENTDKKDTPIPSPLKFFEMIIEFTNKLPRNLRAAIQKPILDTKEIIFKDVSDSYGNGQVGGANDGIINYYSSEINHDAQLVYDTIQFYTNIYSDRMNTDGNHGQVWDRSKKDYWKIAMQTTNEDPWRAIRVLGIKGHDVCCNLLNSKYFKNREAYYFGPLADAVSKYRETMLYQIGSIGGIVLPNSIIEMFNLVRKQAIELGINQYYRAGHYHFIGGVLLAEELLRKNNEILAGIRMPTLISDFMGYAYKRLRIQSYLSADAKVLFESGCRFDKCKKPETWDELKFKKAMYSLNSNLAFLKLTAWQHREGARFAWNVLHKGN